MGKKILIVDDFKSNRDLLKAILLPHGYEIEEASNGKEGFEKIYKLLPDIVLLDINMPEMNGFEVCRKVKKDNSLPFIPIVLITASDRMEDKIQGLKEGADEFLTKPVVPSELILRVQNLIKIKDMNEKLLNYSIDLEREVDEKTAELRMTLKDLQIAQIETIFRLALAAEYKDLGAYSHIKRVSLVVKTISKELKLNENEVEVFQIASSMHDIGKIGIPDSILLKKGKFTDEEYNMMKKHTLIGAKILSGSNFPYLKVAKEIAEYHHEKYNGEGYPHKKKSEEIPLSARIAAVADVFDALVSKRSYKEKWEIPPALDLIENEAGKHFDYNVVDAFFKAKDKIIEITNRFSEEEYTEGEKLFQKFIEDMNF